MSNNNGLASIIINLKHVAPTSCSHPSFHKESLCTPGHRRRTPPSSPQMLCLFLRFALALTLTVPVIIGKLASRPLPRSTQHCVPVHGGQFSRRLKIDSREWPDGATVFAMGTVELTSETVSLQSASLGDDDLAVHYLHYIGLWNWTFSDPGGLNNNTATHRRLLNGIPESFVVEQCQCTFTIRYLETLFVDSSAARVLFGLMPMLIELEPPDGAVPYSSIPARWVLNATAVTMMATWTPSCSRCLRPSWILQQEWSQADPCRNIERYSMTTAVKGGGNHTVLTIGRQLTHDSRNNKQRQKEYNASQEAPIDLNRTVKIAEAVVIDWSAAPHWQGLSKAANNIQTTACDTTKFVGSLPRNVENFSVDASLADGSSKFLGGSLFDELFGANGAGNKFLDAQFQRHVALARTSGIVRGLLLLQTVQTLFSDFEEQNLKVTLLSDGKRSEVHIPHGGADQFVDKAMEQKHAISLRFEELTGNHRLWRLQHGIAQALSTPVTCHVYISGVGVRSLDIHGDPYDVFAVQIRGVKIWTICAPKLLASSETCLDTAEQAMGYTQLLGCSNYKESDLEDWDCERVQTRPGDVLYMPRGVVHHASAGSDEVSVHATFGLNEKGRLWGDFLDRLLASNIHVENSSPSPNTSFSELQRRTSFATRFVDWHRTFPVWKCARNDGSKLSVNAYSASCHEVILSSGSRLRSFAIFLLSGHHGPLPRNADRLVVREAVANARRFSTFLDAVGSFVAEANQFLLAGEPSSHIHSEVELRVSNIIRRPALAKAADSEIPFAEGTLPRVMEGSGASGLFIDRALWFPWILSGAHRNSLPVFSLRLVELEAKHNLLASRGRPGRVRTRRSQNGRRSTFTPVPSDPLVISARQCSENCENDCDTEWTCNRGQCDTNNCNNAYKCCTLSKPDVCPKVHEWCSANSDNCGITCDGDCDDVRDEGAFSCDHDCTCQNYCNDNCNEWTCTEGTIKDKALLAPQNVWRHCKECDAGKYSTGTSSTSCIPCDKGKYQDKAGKTACLNCPAGKHQELKGQSKCLDCEAGKVSNKPGMIACDVCDAGKYQPQKRKSSCLNCPAGKHQELKGQSKCLDCEAGKVSDKAGMIACDVCDAGKYQPQKRKSSCLNCAKGTYRYAPPSTACNNCELGKYQPSEGEDSCLECSVGKYQNKEARISCLDCPDGKYQDVKAQSNCRLCQTNPDILDCTRCNKADGMAKPLEGKCVDGGKCYDAITSDAEQSNAFPNVLHGSDFDAGASNEGCKFCSSLSPYKLLNVNGAGPCPSKLCLNQSDSRDPRRSYPVRTICVEGKCEGDAESRCKPCHVCRDPGLGCKLKEWHCELEDGSCGCSINGICFSYNATEPGNVCRRASRDLAKQLDLSNVAFCTGKWENWVDGDFSVSAGSLHCAGWSACRKKQICFQGTCSSEPYDNEPLPCHSGFECRGGNNTYYYLGHDAGKQCRNSSDSDPCDLPEFCTNMSFACPKHNIASPLIRIGSASSLSLINSESHGARNVSQGYVSHRTFLRHVGDVSKVCRDSNLNMLDRCPALLSNGKWLQCGGAVRRTVMLQVQAKNEIWHDCSDAMLRDSVLIPLGSDSHPSVVTVAGSAASNMGIRDDGNSTNSSSASNSSSVCVQETLAPWPESSTLALECTWDRTSDGQTVRGVLLFELEDFPDEKQLLCSTPAIIDNSPPPQGSLHVHGMQGPSGRLFVNTTGSLTVEWKLTEWLDPHSGFREIYVSVFVASNPPAVLHTEWIRSLVTADMGVLTIEFLPQLDGTRVFAQITMVNRVGLKTASEPVEATLDSSPPLVFQTGDTVRDCYVSSDDDCAIDIDFQSTLKYLTASWNTSSYLDPESQIQKVVVKLQLISSVGHWLDIAGPCPVLSDASNATFLHSPQACSSSRQEACLSACLVHGATYRIAVLAVNGAGLPDESLAIGWLYSDGVRLDVTAPDRNRVSMHNPNGRGDTSPCLQQHADDIQGSSSEVWVSWESFNDPESEMLYYFWEVGEVRNSNTGFEPTVQGLELLGFERTDGSTVNRSHPAPHFESWAGWFRGCLNCRDQAWPELRDLRVYREALHLRHNMLLMVRLTCVNDAGLATSVLTAAMRVDLTGPDASQAKINDVVSDRYQDSEYVASPERLFVFAAGFQDCTGQESDPRNDSVCGGGISSYQYGFGTTPGSDDVLPLSVEQCNAMPFATPKLALQSGTRYFATVRVCNNARICNNFSSDGIIADFTPPVAGLIVDGNQMNQDVDFMRASTVFCTSWTNFSDAESGIEGYDVAWGPCSVLKSFGGLSFQRAGLEINSTFCFYSVELVEGIVYCSALRTRNRAGSHTVTLSDGVLVAGPPTAGQVYDGQEPGVDVEYQADNETLSVTWTEFRENGAPLDHHIITMFQLNENDGSQRAVYGPVRVDLIHSWSVQLQLAHAGFYVSEVCIVDLLDHLVCSRSNGVTVDMTPPIAGSVANGPLATQHVYVQLNASAVHVSWTGFQDEESDLQSFEWALGSTQEGSDILRWTNVGLNTTAQVSSLLLLHGDVLYACVRATNRAALSAYASSPAITIHTIPPLINHIHVTIAGPSPVRPQFADLYWYLSSGLELIWELSNDTTVFNSALPPPKTFVSIGTLPGIQDVQQFREVASQPYSLPDLQSGAYFVSLLALDDLGRTDHAISKPLNIDVSAPLIGDLVFPCTRFPCWLSNIASLSIKWKKFHDPDSSIDRYHVGIGSEPEADDVHAFVDVGRAEDATLQGPFPPGAAFVTVVAVNLAHLAVSASAQVWFDATPPMTSEVREVVSGRPASDVDCQEATSEIHAAWDACIDLESGIAKYEVALMLADGTEDSGMRVVQPFRDVGLSVTWRFEQSMRVGERYHIAVRAWNWAGLCTTIQSNGVLSIRPSHAISELSMSSVLENDLWIYDGMFVVSADTQQPWPTVDVSFGTCERCENIHPFMRVHTTNGMDGEVSEQNNCSGVSGNQALCLKSISLRYNECNDDSSCVKMRFFVKWTGRDILPTFFVVKTTSCATAEQWASTPLARPDITPPVQGLVFLPQPTPYQNAFSQVVVAWNGFHDPEIGLDRYLVGIGSEPEADDVHAFVDVGRAEDATLQGPFPPGAAFVTVVAVNLAHLAVSASAQVWFDATPPMTSEVREVVSGRPASDVDCQEATSEIHAAWDACIDLESGIAKYEVALMLADGTEDSGMRVVQPFRDVGLSVTWRFEQSMRVGERYHIAVRAWNSVGLNSEMFSNGTLILTIGTLAMDLSGFALRSANFTHFLVAGSMSISGLFCAVQSVGVFVGTVSGGTQIQGLFSIYERIPLENETRSLRSANQTLVWSFVFEARPGIHGSPLFISSRVALCSGGFQVASQNLGVVDMTPPSLGAVVGTVRERVNGHSTISVQWTGFEDAQGRLESFYVCIGEREGSANIINWTRAGLENALDIPVHISLPQQAFVTVKASNIMGLSSTVSSEIEAEIRPRPSFPFFVTLTGLKFENVTISAFQRLSVVWDSYFDETAKILNYEYAFVCENDVPVVSPFVSTQLRQLEVSFAVIASIPCRSSFHVVVRGWNDRRLYADGATRSLKYINHARPQIEAVQDGLVFDEDFSSSSTALASKIRVQHCVGEVCRYQCGLGLQQYSDGVRQLNSAAISRILDLDVQPGVATPVPSIEISCVIEKVELEHDRTYYFVWKVEFGDESVMATTNGSLVDLTPPIRGRLTAFNAGVRMLQMPVQPVFIASNSTLRVAWSSFEDFESGIMSASLFLQPTREASCAQMKTGSPIVVLGAIDPNIGGLNVNVERNELSDGSLFCLCVDIRNRASLSTLDCVLLQVDNTPPTVGLVRDGTDAYDAQCQSSADTLSASWEGFASKRSPVVFFQWAAGTCAFCTDLVDYATVPANTTMVRHVLDTEIPVNTIIYTSVRAVSATGLVTEASSDGVRVICSGGNCIQDESLLCV